MGMGRVDDVSLVCSLENWPSMCNRKRRSWQGYVELVPGGVSCKCLISLYVGLGPQVTQWEMDGVSSACLAFLP